MQTFVRFLKALGRFIFTVLVPAMAAVIAFTVHAIRRFVVWWYNTQKGLEGNKKLAFVSVSVLMSCFLVTLPARYLSPPTPTPNSIAAADDGTVEGLAQTAEAFASQPETPQATDTLAPTSTDEPTVPATVLAVSSVGPTDTPLPQDTATSAPPEDTATPQAPEGDRATVINIVDGDTIDVLIDGVEHRVRYIGMDTPERGDYFFSEASQANSQLVQGKEVRLVKDVSETDRFGRLLRYAYLLDGTFINAELVRRGYAQASTYPPDVRHSEDFVVLQREARNSGAGLWAQPVVEATSPPAPAPTAPPQPTQPPAPQPTVTVAPPPPPPPTATAGAVAACDCSGNTLNCSAFGTHSSAQACFAYCWEQVGFDVHQLDGDADGLACESLP